MAMNKYSRIKAIGNTKNSTCMDFSDPLTSPDPTHHSSNNFIETKHAEQIVGSPNKTKNSSNSSNNNTTNNQHLQEEPDQESEESFSMKLRRNSSVSSASKRVLSLTRSSSVSESYSRIHNQSMASESPSRTLEDLAEETTRSSSGKKNRAKRRSLFRSCKKLFGF